MKFFVIGKSCHSTTVASRKNKPTRRVGNACDAVWKTLNYVVDDTVLSIDYASDPNFAHTLQNMHRKSVTAT